MKLKPRLISILLTCAMLFTLIPAAAGGQSPLLTGNPANKENIRKAAELSNQAATSDYDIFDALEILKHLIKMINLNDFEKEVYNLTDNKGTPSIFDVLEVLKHLIGMEKHTRRMPPFPPTEKGGAAIQKAGGVWEDLGNGRYRPPSGWNPADTLVWSPPKGGLNWFQYSNGDWGEQGENPTTNGIALTSDTTNDIITTDAQTEAPCPGANTNGTCQFIPWCNPCSRTECTLRACEHPAVRTCDSGNADCKKLGCETACKPRVCEKSTPGCNIYECQTACHQICFTPGCNNPWSCQPDCECLCDGPCGTKPPHELCEGGCNMRHCAINLANPQHHPFQTHMISGATITCNLRQCQGDCTLRTDCKAVEKCTRYTCQGVCDCLPPATTSAMTTATPAPAATTDSGLPGTTEPSGTNPPTTAAATTSSVGTTTSSGNATTISSNGTDAPDGTTISLNETTVTSTGGAPGTTGGGGGGTTVTTTATAGNTTTSGGTAPTTTMTTGGTTTSGGGNTTTTAVTTTTNNAGQGNTRVLYDMKTDPNFANLEKSGNSDHPLFVRNSGVPDTNTTDKTVTISGRTGTSQGLRFKVGSLPTSPNHEYTLIYGGEFSNHAAAATGVARIRSEGSSVAPQYIALSAPAVNGMFSMSITKTAEQLALDAVPSGSAAVTYSLGCATAGVTSGPPIVYGPDIKYTDLRIIETCPVGCQIPGCGVIPTEKVLYNMQKDVELFKIDTASSSSPGNKHTWLQAGNSGAGSGTGVGSSFVDMGWKTPNQHSFKYIGGSSGHTFDVKLSAITVRANHSYKFDFSGTLISGSSGTFTLSAAPDDAVGTPLKTQTFTTNVPFTLTYEVSATTIASQKASGATLYRISGFTNTRTINFTDITVTAQCPPSCTSCVPMADIPPVKSPLGTISSSLTAAALIGRINAGWNLGNTFDYHSDSTLCTDGPGYGLDEDKFSVIRLETSWISYSEYATTRTLFQKLKSEGINAVRIPVTWHKAADPNNNWAIRKDFMARVKQVVDWALAEDMIVILNSHHDLGRNFPAGYRVSSTVTLDTAVDRTIIPLTGTATSSSHKGRIFIEQIWKQIAAEFKDYNENLMFEGLNEPRTIDGSNEWNGGSQTERDNLNALNKHFVDTVRATGGNNQYRILVVPTHGAGANNNSIDGFKKPADAGSRIAMSVHSYEPFGWAHDATSGGYPGSGAIVTALTRIKTKADSEGVAVILGEFGSIRHADG
ncbi:MAG: glycoside hydrolase family 5 protein, partial [Oscillospiraceae bacterium]|nr:glycoside hydrolase family 5 protein [Oscillospiraceae bacterium]